MMTKRFCALGLQLGDFEWNCFSQCFATRLANMSLEGLLSLAAHDGFSSVA